MRRPSVASTRLPIASLDDSDWHTLGELRTYESLLLSTRQDDSTFSDAVRVDPAPSEKLRRDELLAFLNFAKHTAMPDRTRFRKPTYESGVDIEYSNNAGPGTRLQITTAYRVSFDAKGKELSGGHQNQLFREKLSLEGTVSESGPFERRGDKIIDIGGGASGWEEFEQSCCLGIVNAFKRKANHGDKDTSLLVKAVQYYEETMQDLHRFLRIVDTAAAIVFPGRFAKVIVVDYGDGFIWTR